MKEDRDLVDQVTYLALLVSQPDAIDPLLDNVRVISARWNPSLTLSSRDRATLREVKSKIEYYLINNDPLRTFTPELLQERMDEHFRMATMPSWRSYVQRARWNLVGVWTLAALGFLIGFMSSPSLPLSMRAGLGGAAFVVVLYTCICWFYVSALKNFKSEPLKAYAFICAGILLTGAGASQFPITAVFNIASQPLFRYGGFLVFFAFSCVSLYIGLHIFAATLGIKSRLTSWGLVASITLGISLLLVLLPHASLPQNEFFFNLSLVSLVFCIVPCIFSGLLAYRIAEAIAQTYGPAMQWLGLTLLLVSVGSTMSGLVIYLNGSLYGSVQLAITNIPFVISGYCMLEAGYLFKKRAEA